MSPSKTTPRVGQPFHGQVEVGHGEAELGVRARRGAGRGEDHELGAAAEVAQPALALLDRLEAELLGVPGAGPVEVLRRQPHPAGGVVERTGRPRRSGAASAASTPAWSRSAGRSCRRGPRPCRTTARRRGTRRRPPTSRRARRGAGRPLDVGHVVVEDEPAGLDGPGSTSSRPSMSTPTWPTWRKPSGSGSTPSASVYHWRRRVGSALPSSRLSSEVMHVETRRAPRIHRSDAPVTAVTLSGSVVEPHEPSCDPDLDLGDADPDARPRRARTAVADPVIGPGPLDPVIELLPPLPVPYAPYDGKVCRSGSDTVHRRRRSRR